MAAMLRAAGASEKNVRASEQLQLNGITNSQALARQVLPASMCVYLIVCD
jgi:hypothetical protein